MKNSCRIFVLLLSISFFSCGEESGEVQIPAGIMSKEEFANVLKDLALAESAANLNIKNVKIEKTDSTYNFDPFKENNITQEQYNASSLFYSAHPDLYKEAYEEAMRMLSEMQAKRNEIKKDTTKRDSVKK